MPRAYLCDHAADCTDDVGEEARAHEEAYDDVHPLGVVLGADVAVAHRTAAGGGSDGILRPKGGVSGTSVCFPREWWVPATGA